MSDIVIDADGRGYSVVSAPAPAPEHMHTPGVTLREHVAGVLPRLEREYLEAALKFHRGHMQATAFAAGISRRTLLRKMIKHGLARRRAARHAVAQLPRSV